MTPITAALRKLAAKATPGPWTVDPYIVGEDAVFGGAVMAHGGTYAVTDAGGEGLSPACSVEDAAYIAALSPDTLNLLLDVVDSAVAFCTDWAGDPDFGPATDRLVEAIAALEADHAV